MNNDFHVICPCCGTEIEVPTGKGGATIDPSNMHGTYFLVPKNKRMSNNMMNELINMMNRQDPDHDIKREARSPFDVPKKLDTFEEDKLPGNTSGCTAPQNKVNKSVDASAGSTETDRSAPVTPVKNVFTDELEKIKSDINQDGYLSNRHLFRRWIMAQTLRTFYRNRLENGMYRNRLENGMDAFHRTFITETPYKYQWEVIRDEFFRMDMMMKDNDPELNSREKFFNRNVLKAMLNDYMVSLERTLNTELRRKSARSFNAYVGGNSTKVEIKYVELKGYHPSKFRSTNKDMALFLAPFDHDAYNIWIISDADAKFMEQNGIAMKPGVNAIGISRFMAFVNLIVQHVNTKPGVKKMYKTMCDYVRNFIDIMPMKVTSDRCSLKKSKAWINAFKGSGAYYTLENLIKYHGCDLYNNDVKIADAGTTEAVDALNKLREDLLQEEVESGEESYYRLFATLRNTIEHNNLEEKIKHQELY